MATLTHDDFTAANGTVVGGRAPPTTVGGATWTDISSGDIITIQGNRAAPGPGPPSYALRAALIDCGQSDGIVSLDVTTGTLDAWYGLRVRHQDSANYWLVGINPASGLLGIVEVNASAATVRDSAAASIAASTTYTVAVVLSGNTITATVNGAHLISYTSSFLNTATIVGFTGDTTGFWDNFDVATAPIVVGKVSVVVTGATTATAVTGGGSGGAPPLDYKFQLAPNVPSADPYGQPGTFVDNGTFGAASHNFTGLTPGTQYWVRAVWRDNTGATATTRPVWFVPVGVPAFPPLSTGGIVATYRWETDALTLVDGTGVATLTEQGGSGKDLAGTGTNKPEYQSKGWPFARPCLRFKAASSHYLQAAAAADWKFLNDGTPWTVFIVFRTNNNSTTSNSRWPLLNTSAGSGTGVNFYYDNRAGDGVASFFQATIRNSGTGANPLNVNASNIADPFKSHAFCITFDGTNCVIYNWDVQVASGSVSGTLPNTNPAGPLTVGIDAASLAGDAADMDLPAVVVVEGAVLSAANRHAVYACLEAKWHVAGNVPKEFFLDATQVDKWSGTRALSGLTVAAVSPVKSGSNPLMGGTGSYDDFILFMDMLKFGEGDYRLWAGVGYYSDPSTFVGYSAYATSTDLITWTKPVLNQITYGGNTNNNLFGPTDSPNWYLAGVWYSAVGTPVGPFVGNLNIDPTHAAGVFVMSTADPAGVTGWNEIGTVNASYTDGEGGGITPLPDGRWVMTSTLGQPGARSCYLKQSDTADPSGTWTDVGVVIPGTLADQYHGMIPRVFLDANCWVCTCGQLDQVADSNATIHLGLFVTRDGGRTFTRAKKLWLPALRDGSWDGNEVLLATKPITLGGVWKWLYTAENGKNYIVTGDTIPSKLGLFTTPIERLMKLTGTGTWTGRAIYQPGQSLNVNADGSGGTITFALLDSAGNVISGYDDASSTVISSDKPYPGYTNTWGPNKTLPDQIVVVRATLTGVTGGLSALALGAAIPAGRGLLLAQQRLSLGMGGGL